MYRGVEHGRSKRYQLSASTASIYPISVTRVQNASLERLMGFRYVTIDMSIKTRPLLKKPERYEYNGFGLTRSQILRWQHDIRHLLLSPSSAIRPLPEAS